MESCHADNIKLCVLDKTIMAFTEKEKEKDKKENISAIKNENYGEMKKIPSCNIKLHVESVDESQTHMCYEDSDRDELRYYSDIESPN